jgi:hypothetical protein
VRGILLSGKLPLRGEPGAEPELLMGAVVSEPQTGPVGAFRGRLVVLNLRPVWPGKKYVSRDPPKPASDRCAVVRVHAPRKVASREGVRPSRSLAKPAEIPEDPMPEGFTKTLEVRQEFWGKTQPGGGKEGVPLAPSWVLGPPAPSCPFLPLLAPKQTPPSRSENPLPGLLP